MQGQLLQPEKPRFQGDPRLAAAVTALGKFLVQFTGAPITEGLIKTIQEHVDDFRVTARLRGIDMPKMVVVAFPHAGFIQVWPREQEAKDLNLRLVSLIRQFKAQGRPCDPEELAKAIRRAYPEYSPSTAALKIT